MQASCSHAIQPVHEAQNLTPPGPLPRELRQFSKNHMWRDATPELQKLPGKGNLHPAIPFSPDCKVPEQKVPQSSRWNDKGLTALW